MKKSSILILCIVGFGAVSAPVFAQQQTTATPQPVIKTQHKMHKHTMKKGEHNMKHSQGMEHSTTMQHGKF